MVQKTKWAYVTVVLVLMLLASGGLVWYKLASAQHAPAIVAKTMLTPTPSPTPPPAIYDPLTALPVATTVAAEDPVVRRHD